MFYFKDFIDCWNNLFFDQINYPSLGIFRILIGIICLFKLFLLLSNRYEYFGAKGNYPYNSWKNYYEKNYYFSIFHYLKPNDFSVDIVFFLGIVFSLFLILGFCTEISCFVTYLLWLSLHHRNVYMFNSGDCLLRIMLLLLIFSGCGYYISFDNVIHHRKQLDLCISPWIVRLMQIILLNVYFQSVYSKLHYSEVWIKGTGAYYSLNNKSVNRYDLSLFLNKYVFIFLNYNILIAESIIVLGLIFKETSTICVFILIIIHVLFEIFLRLNFFGIIMVSCLILFLNNNDIIKILTH